MTAVQVERDAVLRGLKGDKRFDVSLAGVGPAAAAANTARILATVEYDPGSERWYWWSLPWQGRDRLPCGGK